MDSQISEVLDYYGRDQTRAETTILKGRLDVIQFIVQTFIYLHLLTCIQIALCTYREFSKSWMGSKEIKPDDTTNQYIIALYFVTTTLSTCGFGDIGATPGDAVEAGVILFL